MNNIAISKKTLALMIGLVILILLIGLILFFRGGSKVIEEEAPQEIGEKVNPLLRTSNETTEDRIQNLPGLISKEASSDGTIRYSYQASVPARVDEIWTKDGKVIFEKVATPVRPEETGFSGINEFVLKYGEPEKIIERSKTYGPFTSFYIYPGRGVAFIGNPYTDEIYEIQRFTPTSIDEYIMKYGVDIQTKEFEHEDL